MPNEIALKYRIKCHKNAESLAYIKKKSYLCTGFGLEADLVLHLDDERYALVECKLGSKEIEMGAEHLKEIHRLIIEHNKTEKQVPLREPDLKIILTGGPIAYKRNDGVYIIPLSALKP